MSVTSVRLNDDIAAGLAQVAADTRRSKSSLINEALRDFLWRVKQDEQRGRARAAALDEVHRVEMVDGAEMLKWLTNWGVPSRSGAKAVFQRTVRTRR